MNGTFRVSCVVAIMASFLFLADLSEAGPNWARLYEITKWSDFKDVRTTADGGLIVSGMVCDGFTTDAWCLKLDASANIVWQKRFGGISNESSGELALAAGGGYFLAASTSSSGAGSFDAWCLKLNDAGGVLWQRTYGGAGGEHPSAVCATADGGCVLAGQTYSFGAGGSDIWCLKLDAAGNVVWQKAYGGGNYDKAEAVCTTADGGYVLAGGTYSFGPGQGDAWCLKLDAAGNIAWQKTYGTGVDEDWGTAVCTTADGGYVLAGESKSSGAGSYDAWFLKIDAAGNVVWQSTCGSTGDDNIRDMCSAPDGGYLITGVSESLAAGNSFDMWCLKLDSTGNVAWQKTYGGTGAEQSYAVDLAADGGYILTGNTHSFGVSDTAGWCLKVSSTGSIDPSCPDLGRDAAGVVIPSAAFATDSSATVTPTFVVAVPTAVVGMDSAATATLLCSGGSQGPTITSITSKTSKPGSMATIKGTGFGTDKKKVAVYVGTKKVKNLSRLKTTSIKFLIPRMKKGTYGVYVVVNGAKSNTIQFQIK